VSLGRRLWPDCLSCPQLKKPSGLQVGESAGAAISGRSHLMLLPAAHGGPGALAAFKLKLHLWFMNAPSSLMYRVAVLWERRSAAQCPLPSLPFATWG
jgi:hypothetical protein